MIAQGLLVVPQGGAGKRPPLPATAGWGNHSEANRAAPHLGITAGGCRGASVLHHSAPRPATAIGSQFLSSLACAAPTYKKILPQTNAQLKKCFFKNQRSLSIRTFPQPPLGQYCIINPRKRSQICRKTNDGFGIWR